MVLLSYLLNSSGAAALGVVPNSREHITVIFNGFVFCQIFNEINARNIGDDVNVFAGLFHNAMFLAVIITTVG
jgi:hypothetical protein